MINTTAPHQSGFRRFLSLINLAAVTAVMLAASGCHKDSFNFDEITRPTATPDTGTPDGDDGDEIPGPMTLPTPRNGILLAELDAYDTPDTLAPSAIGNGQSDTVGGVATTGSQYNDADGDAQIFVQEIEFAAFAAFVAPPTAIAAAAVAAQVGQGSTISDFDYVFLGDNSVMNPPSTSDGRGMADYEVEADATYRGLNFFPDGSLTMNFDAATFSGGFSVLGNSPVNYFGDANAMVPDGSGGMRTVAGTDNFDFSVNGDITRDGFEADESGLTIDTAEGFFSALSSFTRASLSGGFYDTDGYMAASSENDPVEIAGAGVIENGGGINDLNFGFLGRCVADCLIGVDIAASGLSVVEGQAIMLVVTSDADAPAGGLDVMFRISSTGLMPNEFTTTPASVCDSNFVCTVRIPAGMDSANLMLTPLSDFSAEPGESWTATLIDGDAYDLAANTDVAFDITDLIAAVGIMTSDTPIEGGAAVTLTITSDLAAPAGGLSVTINIGVAMDGEFTANAEAVCTGLECVVIIPAGGMTVSLILSPLSDFSTEPGERWTATLVDTGAYNPAAGGDDNAAFDIDDLIAAVGIATNDMPIEGGAAVTLTITSDETVPATLTGGLSVTINIVGADAADFNNAVCTNLVCIVTIPAGSNSVSLILSPLSDFSTETGESWRAEIVNGDDYNPATDFNVNFDITDLIAALGIATSDTARIEGGAVTLTITSDLPVPAALTDGLSVTINIVGANAADFTSADCTGLECVVVIPIGMTAATLTIMALDTDSVENIERWTAMIVPVNTVFSVDSNADDADFSITDPTFPTAMNGRTLAELMPLDATPTVLGVDEIRDGGDENATRAAIPITGLRYDDADGNPQIYVQRLTYANLGIWTNGQVPTVISLATATEDDFDNDFRYGFLADNALLGSDLPTTRAQANYEVEGDATYRGVNFFIEGSINAMFTAGTFLSNIGTGGGDALDDFGSANAMVPDVDDLDGDGDTAELRTVAATDRLLIFTNGGINNDGFSGTPRLDQSGGFFADLAAFTSASFSGRFYDDSANYDGMITAPDEVAGTGVIVDGGGTNDLHFGFLGQCFTGCNSFPNIGISSTDSTAQENSGEIVLVIEADANAPADLDVMIQISGTGLMANEFDTTPASACNSLFVCTIRIPSGDMAVSLTLTPIDDSAVETTENWIATVIDGSNYNLNFGSIVVAFDITDAPVPLPIASPDRTLADLNAYATPVELAAGDIRAGDDATNNVGTFVGARYDDAADLPQIYVQRVLERGFAHLGIWTSGQVPTVGEFDHDFRYAALADNAVSNLPTTGLAQYFFEADATYKGVNFFPDGNLVVDFGAGNYRGLMVVNGSSADSYFGPGATLPSGGGFVDGGDSLRIDLAQSDGTIAADGSFSGTWTLPAAGATNAPTGFFSDLAGATGGTIGGRFYHSSGYNPATRDPFEIAGSGMITDTASTTNDLHFGFIGSCVIATAFCGPGNAQITIP